MAGHQALSAAEREKLTALRQKIGESRASRRLGISEHTFARAVAGFPLQRGTRLLVRTRLAELDVERVAA